jgi:hypothetical protein
LQISIRINGFGYYRYMLVRVIHEYFRLVDKMIEYVIE